MIWYIQIIFSILNFKVWYSKKVHQRKIYTHLSIKFCAFLGLLFMVSCKGIITPAPTQLQTSLPSQTKLLKTTTSTPVSPGSFITPIPPTSTLTPSPTPTPVIHIIERGDTLFGVALDYGVTLDALLAANGIEATDILRIGQALIIPLGEEEEYSSSGIQIPTGNMILPTSTPLPLEVIGATLYRTPVDGVWCMGEVLNSMASPVTNLQVVITLLSQDGTKLATGYALASADYLAPGERAPFSFLFSDPPQDVYGIDVQLLTAEMISSITAAFSPLVVLETDGANSGPQYRVRGIVVNDSGQSLGRISVVVTIYDAQKNVIGYRHVVLGQNLVLGSEQSQEFSILLTPQTVGDVYDYQVIAWAVVQ